MRIKWWEDPSRETYKSISTEPIDELPESPIEISKMKSSKYYHEDEKVVFFGHYWLKGNPTLYRPDSYLFSTISCGHGVPPPSVMRHLHR